MNEFLNDTFFVQMICLISAVFYDCLEAVGEQIVELIRTPMFKSDVTPKQTMIV